MELVRDVLDKKVVDRHGREMGRVDRIVLRTADAEAPRMVAIEVGPSALAARVSAVAGRLVAAIEFVFGIRDGRPMRIAADDILGVHDAVKIDVAVGETPAAAVEHGVRRWIGVIPGSS